MGASLNKDRAAIEALLGRVLDSPSFRQSGRLRRLLTFLVEQSLSGKDGEVKESVIAAEVFDRTDYDSRTNSLVRVTVATLRNKLAEYFGGAGQDEPVVIQIPKGSYHPVITHRTVVVRTGRRWWIAGAVTAAAGVAGALFVGMDRGRDRIAVLPFRDLSEEGNLRYFCDGLTDELIDRLAHLSGIQVIGRTSAFHYQGKNEDIRQVGQQLGVAAVLEGSIRRSGDRLRITVQLLGTESRSQLWSQTYETRLDEMFRTQDKIAAAVMRTMTASASAPRRNSKRKENLEAWDHLFRGRAALSANGGLAAAIQEYYRALELDPSFALAHAELARAFNNQVLTGGAARTEASQSALHHAMEAVRLDPDLALGYAVLGRCRLLTQWDWPGCENLSRRALALQPGSALMLTNLGIVLGERGKREAIALLRRAKDLDPLYWSSPQQLGKALYLARDYKQAIRTAETSILDHQGKVGLWFRNFMIISLAEGALGNHERAIEAAERGWAEERDRRNIGWLALAGHAYAESGNRDKANGLLGQLLQIDRARPVAPVLLARVYTGLLEFDPAFQHLYRAVDQRDANLTWMEADPRSDPLRRDARWRPLLKRIGLS